MIPARLEDQGRPLGEVTSEIEAGVRDQCGGELCVTLRTEQRDIEGFTSCSFAKTEPAQRSFVARGSIVVIVAGAAACEDTSQPDTLDDTTTSPTTETTPEEANTTTTGSPNYRESIP